MGKARGARLGCPAGACGGHGLPGPCATLGEVRGHSSGRGRGRRARGPRPPRSCGAALV